MPGSWVLGAFKENEYTAANCDCVELPKNAETGRRASSYNGLGWAASASGEHTDEAWQLIEYLGSKEAQEKQAELGVTRVHTKIHLMHGLNPQTSTFRLI